MGTWAIIGYPCPTLTQKETKRILQGLMVREGSNLNTPTSATRISVLTNQLAIWHKGSRAGFM